MEHVLSVPASVGVAMDSVRPADAGTMAPRRCVSISAVQDVWAAGVMGILATAHMGVSLSCTVISVTCPVLETAAGATDRQDCAQQQLLLLLLLNGQRRMHQKMKGEVYLKNLPLVLELLCPFLLWCVCSSGARDRIHPVNTVMTIAMTSRCCQRHKPSCHPRRTVVLLHQNTIPGIMFWMRIPYCLTLAGRRKWGEKMSRCLNPQPLPHWNSVNQHSHHTGNQLSHHTGNLHSHHTGNLHSHHTGNQHSHHTGNQLSHHTRNQLSHHTGNLHSHHTGNLHSHHTGNQHSHHTGNLHSHHTGNQHRLHTGNQHSHHTGNQHSTHTENQHSHHTGNQHSTHTGNQHSHPIENQHSTHTGNQQSHHTEYLHSHHTGNQQSPLLNLYPQPPGRLLHRPDLMKPPQHTALSSLTSLPSTSTSQSTP